jgi:hypothetical protein
MRESYECVAIFGVHATVPAASHAITPSSMVLANRPAVARSYV